ncbi:phosphatidylglycerophosphate synthase [Paenibacillus odorifer]|uniref:CDP-alcohol phosphatidyltransferase family protein n=1 Tax=Paenibacillus TaxID=44249 RepID=UPI0003E1D3A0|nr:MULTISPECIES: CDP-alcohol phosphatidyltransferase family protein [Paenibacillus]ETT46029.1 CDP-alcohol phosphatidyltransferase [Paenibacillus sp. FSL H8-237]OMD22129.1 phosphatidylglycerophosphate synthase [Paenibacillus odorifer]OME59392.1 phosphatidylglycerophosphate synthase [Paenibacillus odorifer]OME63595.1 phosphatidylglycerophosphate synthase [Paenibacillus odorifer]
MKVIPNCITLGRIILAIMLLFFEPLSSPFLAIYILCGVTDLIDGPIARKSGTTSLGAKLDSAADTILIGISLFTLYPLLSLTLEFILWIFLIAVIRLTAIGIALRRFKTYASIHTYGNKLTGLLLFVTPIWLSHSNHTIWTTIVCIVATLSAVEELIIQITSTQLQLDRKGWFYNHPNQE